MGKVAQMRRCKFGGAVECLMAPAMADECRLCREVSERVRAVGHLESELVSARRENEQLRRLAGELMAEVQRLRKRLGMSPRPRRWERYAWLRVVTPDDLEDIPQLAECAAE